MKRSENINAILKPLRVTPNQAYLSTFSSAAGGPSNAVQFADILEWILSQVGKAEVGQTSFSISEEFLRCLFFMRTSTKSLGSAKNANKVSRINLVLDHKATNKTLKLWAFITQVIERTYLADNHSKILLVKSEAGDCGCPTGQPSGRSGVDEQAPDSSRCWTVSVVTSQNLTRGNRAESAFISTDPEIFAGLFAQVNDLITNHSVPLNELFAQRLGENSAKCSAECQPDGQCPS